MNRKKHARIWGMMLLIGLFLLPVGCGGNDDGGASKSGGGSSGVQIIYRVEGDSQPSEEDMQDTLMKLQKRAERYSPQAAVYLGNDGRIFVELPGMTDGADAAQELAQKGEILFIMEMDDAGNPNYAFVYENADDGSMQMGYRLERTLETIRASGSMILESEDIQSATAGISTDTSGRPYPRVDIALTQEGSRKFAEATEKAVGKMSIGIYCDGAFISVPSVHSVITDGNVQITGLSDYEEAENIASRISSGMIKLELRLSELKRFP